MEQIGDVPLIPVVVLLPLSFLVCCKTVVGILAYAAFLIKKFLGDVHFLTLVGATPLQCVTSRARDSKAGRHLRTRQRAERFMVNKFTMSFLFMTYIFFSILFVASCGMDIEVDYSYFYKHFVHEVPDNVNLLPPL